MEYKEKVSEIFERLKTNINGLDSKEAEKRLKENGLNITIYHKIINIIKLL